MRRRRILVALGLVVVAAGSALVVVLAGSYRGGDGEETAAPALAAGIEVRGSLAPRTILFGDTIVASVDVVLDRLRVDPESVRVATEFLPWEIVGEPQSTRRDAGDTTHLRTAFTLRCVSSPCLPANQAAALEFDRARVTFTRREADRAGRASVGFDWPLLLVYSRFAAANLEGPPSFSNPNPWRADLVTLPAVSYRVAPGLLVVLLVSGAGVLALAGAALAYIAVPRREQALPPEPEPELEPETMLTPLEQALVLLEDANRANGAEDRRRALELVAEELAQRHPDLARAARTLAWSEDEPLVEDTSGLAGRVRSVVEVDRNGDGHAV